MKQTLMSNKKRKILLGTLIPLGCLVLTTAIVVPVVLTQCKGTIVSFKTWNAIELYVGKKIKNPDISEWNPTWTNGARDNPEMLAWIDNNLDNKNFFYALAYELATTLRLELHYDDSDIKKMTIDHRNLKFNMECHVDNENYSILKFAVAKKTNLNCFSEMSILIMEEGTMANANFAGEVKAINCFQGDDEQKFIIFNGKNDSTFVIDILFPITCWKNINFPAQI